MKRRDSTVMAWLAILALSFMGSWACRKNGRAPEAKTADSGASSPENIGDEPPAEMRNFVIYVTDKGVVNQEVHGDQCYLYEKLNIAHLRGLHVDFFEEGSTGKDTLDAPEGYLYLQDFILDKKGDARIGPTHPFYQRIGGKNANIDLLTTTTRLVGGIPAQVSRNRNDIDLVGRPLHKVVYHRADGTSVSCLRAYRDAKRRILYGVDDCEMRRVVNNQVQVTKGEVFTSDDQVKKITIRGKPKWSFGEGGEAGPQPPESVKRSPSLPGKEQKK